MPSIFSSKSKPPSATKPLVSGPTPFRLPSADDNSSDAGDQPWMNVPTTPPARLPIPPVPESPSRHLSRKAFHKSLTATEIITLYQDRRETTGLVTEPGLGEESEIESSRRYPRATGSQYSLNQYGDNENALYSSADDQSRTEVIPGSSQMLHPKPILHTTGRDVLSRSMSKYHKNTRNPQRSAFGPDIAAGEKPISSHKQISLPHSSQEGLTETTRRFRLRADDAWDLNVQQRFWMHHQTMRIDAKDLLKREKVLKTARKEQKERNRRNMFDITWSPRRSATSREEP